MSDEQKLATEFATDPLGIGYAGMTTAQKVTALNAVTRTQPRATMTGTEVLNAIVVAEFNALSADSQSRIWSLLGIGELNPFGVEATIITNAFGGGSATVAALSAKRNTLVSRASQLKLQETPVLFGMVQRAEAI